VKVVGADPEGQPLALEALPLLRAFQVLPLQIDQDIVAARRAAVLHRTQPRHSLPDLLQGAVHLLIGKRGGRPPEGKAAVVRHLEGRMDLEARFQI
jgi:hypothetical protein